jgi:hypothetical protein
LRSPQFIGLICPLISAGNDRRLGGEQPRPNRLLTRERCGPSRSGQGREPR